jgi:hypothetical protein
MLGLFTAVMIAGLVIITNQKQINSRLWEVQQPVNRVHKTVMLSHRRVRVQNLYLRMVKEKNECKEKQALYLMRVIDNRLAELSYKDNFIYN